MNRFLMGLAALGLALVGATAAASPPGSQAAAEGQPSAAGSVAVTLDNKVVIRTPIHEGKTNLLSKLGWDVDLDLSADSLTLVVSFLGNEVYKKTLTRGPKHYSYCKDIDGLGKLCVEVDLFQP